MTDTLLNKPWFNPPNSLPIGSQVAVLGGGISGVLTAYHLMKEGFKVSVFEKNLSLMSEASGNPIAILDPYVSLGESIEKDFFLNAYTYAVEFYNCLGSEIFEPCGLIKIAKDEEERLRFKKISKNYSKEILFFKTNQLIFPKSGYLKPQLIAANLDTNIIINLSTEINHLKLNQDSSWSLFNTDDNLISKADAVVICNAYNVNSFSQSEYLKLDKISGQITYLKPEYKEKNVLCSDGYLTPPVQTKYGEINICGASFDQNLSPEINEKSNKENLEKIPFNFKNHSPIGGRRNIRAMSPDHLPLLGPVANYDEYLKAYSSLHHGPTHMNYPNAPYHDNLFVNVGLGARGFLTAPLLGKILAAQLSGNKSPISEKIRHALHPSRFILRKLSKK